MDSHPRITGGALIRCKRAWLITWDWAGDHAKVDDKLVAVLNYRFSSSTIERIIEQVYVSSNFAFHEQLAYAKSRKHSPYRVEYGTVEIRQKTRAKSTLPSVFPFADDMMYGDNPWLWARVVYDLEAYTDEGGHEHLRWKERQRPVHENGELRSEWEECNLIG